MTRSLTVAVLSGLALAGLGSQAAKAQTLQPTAFTYQGHLNNGGSPYSGVADFRFSLYSFQDGGPQLGAPFTQTGVPVTNGLFVAKPDFGATRLAGGARWVMIEVRIPAGSGDYTPLVPRQALTGAPLALQTRGLFVNDAGAVGIGTTSPRVGLDVATSTGDPSLGAVNGTSTLVNGNGVIGVADQGTEPFGVWGLSAGGVGVAGYSTTGFGGFFNAPKNALLGNTGINTMSPTVSLEVAATGSGFAPSILVRGGRDIAVPTAENLTFGHWDGTNTSIDFNIDPAGNVSVGTGTATSKLSVVGNADFSGNVGVGTVPGASRLSVAGNADFSGNVGMGGAPGASRLSVIGNADFSGNIGVGTAPGANKLTVAGTAYISGNTGIGTASPQSRLHVSGGDIQIDNTYRLKFGGTSDPDPVFIRRYQNGGSSNATVLEIELGNDPGGASSTNDALIITAADATLFQFNTYLSGGIAGQALKNGGGAWAALSDARCKHDIQPLTGVLDRVLSLQGRTYVYNDPKQAGAGPGRHTGFIAQEVEKVFPQWIGERADGMKTLGIMGFEALTVESLRELRAEKDEQIEALRAENAALRADHNELTRRLERLEALLEKRP